MNKTKSIAIILIILCGLILIMFPGIIYYFWALKHYADVMSYIIFYIITIIIFAYAKNILKDDK